MGKTLVLLFHGIKYTYRTVSKKNRIEGMTIEIEPHRENP